MPANSPQVNEATRGQSPATASAPAETGRARASSKRNRLAGHARQFGTLIGLLALCTVLWILTPHFLTVSNLLNVAEQTSINAIVAVGMTFVILSGGIDLSVGSLVALAGVTLGLALQAGQPLAVAVAL